MELDAQKSEIGELEKKIHEAGLPLQVERKALIEKERLRVDFSCL